VQDNLRQPSLAGRSYHHLSSNFTPEPKTKRPCRAGLFPPHGLTLHIGKPANGVVFDRAKLLNGRGVILHRVRSGYKLTLPTEMKWGRVDTVIALNVK
jgi:hypothetical protein